MVKLYVFGCGGHARSVVDIYLNLNPQSEIIFIDANAKTDEKIFSFPVLKDVSEQLLQQNELFFASGDNEAREGLFNQYSSFNVIHILSAKAHISNIAKINRGCFVGNFCHVGPESFIEENTIINNGAIIEHEVKIGKHCHIAPNVAISGRTTIGNHVFVGVGATVINNLQICDNVIIGAGSTVIKSISEPGTYVGSPAKKIK